jgi:uncharacterized cupin superfamily protein
MVEEAKLEPGKGGLVPVGDGWFVVNVAQGNWVKNEAFGSACIFEGEPEFSDLGISLQVLAPGESNGYYHREPENQEDFLVISGECLVLVEEQERRLEAWDFVHCPPDTDHIFVGAGEGPCVILMVGTRRSPEIIYPRSELALRHGASVESDANSPREAYATCPRNEPGGGESWPGLGLA